MPINRKLQNLFTGVNAKSSTSATDGSLPILYAVDIDGGATEIVTLTVNKKIRVADVWVQLNADGGANANNLQIMDVSDTSLCGSIVTGTAGDNAIVRVAALANNVATIAANGILKFTSTSSDDTAPAVTVYVLCYTVA